MYLFIDDMIVVDFCFCFEIINKKKHIEHENIRILEKRPEKETDLR